MAQQNGKPNRRQIFVNKLKSAKSEDDVIKSFSEYFKLNEARMKEERIDLLLPTILFEFKYDENFGRNLDHVGKVTAQSLHYVREIFDGRKNIETLPQFVCIVDKNEAFLLKTKLLEEFYHNENDYNWSLAPSSPDEKLVKDLTSFIKTKGREINFRIFDLESFEGLADFQKIFIEAVKGNSADILKKKISSKNFQSVFQIWKSSIGKMLEPSLKKETTYSNNFAPYFILDLSKETKLFAEDKKISFKSEGNLRKEYPVNLGTYNDFWSKWERPTDKEFEIISRIRDRIAPEEQRRNAGAFYTDPAVAMKAYEYLEAVYGKDFWKEYKVWDMCSGTGNLELGFPDEAQLYLSTLDASEVPHLQRVFPQSHCFSFDFLNGDYSQLPEVLRKDLEDKKNKWIILMNPPYATSRSGKNKGSKVVESDVGVSGVFTQSATKKEMDLEGLSISSGEATNQFIYRIRKWVKHNLVIAVLSKPKFLTAEESVELRRTVLKCEFKKGFIVSSETFDGTSGKFPITFNVLDFDNRKVELDSQDLEFDILFHQVINHKNTHREIELHNVGKKIFKNFDTISPLNKWVDRPSKNSSNSVNAFPLKNAVELYTGEIRLDSKIKGSLGYLMTTGNDLTQQNLTIIFSEVYGGGNGWDITHDNFEKSMVVFSVRRLPQANFVNDKDQFCQPMKDLTKEFILDCIAYSLFHGSNQSSSMNNKNYNGRQYSIINEFYPFLKEELKSWDFYTQNLNPQKVSKITDKAKDRFLATYLQTNQEHLSTETREVIESAKKIYQHFYDNEASLNIDPKWELDNWDLGFYQIKSALEETKRTDALLLISELRDKQKILIKKLRKDIVDFGFIQDGVVDFNEELVEQIKGRKTSGPKKEEVRKKQAEVIQILETNISELEIDEIDLI